MPVAPRIAPCFWRGQSESTSVWVCSASMLSSGAGCVRIESERCKDGQPEQLKPWSPEPPDSERNKSHAHLVLCVLGSCIKSLRDEKLAEADSLYLIITGEASSAVNPRHQLQQCNASNYTRTGTCELNCRYCHHVHVV